MSNDAKTNNTKVRRICDSLGNNSIIVNIMGLIPSNTRTCIGIVYVLLQRIVRNRIGCATMTEVVERFLNPTGKKNTLFKKTNRLKNVMNGTKK